MENKKINGWKLTLESLVLLLAIRGCNGCVSDVKDITGYVDKYQPSEVVAFKNAYRDNLPEIIIRKDDGRTNRYYKYIPDEKGNYYLLTNEEIFKQAKNLLEKK